MSSLPPVQNPGPRQLTVPDLSSRVTALSASLLLVVERPATTPAAEGVGLGVALTKSLSTFLLRDAKGRSQRTVVNGDSVQGRYWSPTIVPMARKCKWAALRHACPPFLTIRIAIHPSIVRPIVFRQYLPLPHSATDVSTPTVILDLLYD